MINSISVIFKIKTYNAVKINKYIKKGIFNRNLTTTYSVKNYQKKKKIYISF